VHPVGEQSHGFGSQADGDLDEHHRRRYGDDDQSAALARPGHVLAEYVVMRPRL